MDSTGLQDGAMTTHTGGALVPTVIHEEIEDASDEFGIAKAEIIRQGLILWIEMFCDVTIEELEDKHK